MASPSRADHRQVLPARRLVRVAAFTAGAAAIAPFVPGLRAAVFVLAALVAGWALLEFWRRPAPSSVVVHRAAPAFVHVGRAGTFTVEATNRSGAPLVVQVRAALPPAFSGEERASEALLAPDESLRLEVPFVALERGTQKLPPIGVRVRRASGGFEVQADAAADDAIKVLPGRPAGEVAWLIARVDAMAGHAEPDRRLRYGASYEPDGLREFVTGDERRRIDWRASARRHRPMIRQFRAERDAEVVLMLDCGRLMGTRIDGGAKVDLTMAPVLDLAAVALRRGERVGLLAFDSAPLAWLPPRSGSEHLRAMLAAVADLPCGEKPTSYLNALRQVDARQRKRSLIVVFTDFTDALSARELVAALTALSRRHRILFVAVGDPQIERLMDEKDPREAALFQRAVAADLLLERRVVLARLEQHGVPCIDAEPRRLTGALLRRYLELRERSAV